MADIKQLMALGADTLRQLGADAGLTFPAGMKTSQMAMQLSQSVASGWMEQHNDLGLGTGFDEDYGQVLGGTSDMLSDAANVARQIYESGFGTSFHNAMGSGDLKHISVLETYLSKLGASPQDVWMHMPKPSELDRSHSFNELKSYMQNTLPTHQDLMTPLAGHYAGDFMAEYSTPNGLVSDVYEGLAGMYLNRGAYADRSLYQSDLNHVSSLLASQMGGQFHEVAAVTGMGGKASYMSILPQIGDPSIARHVAHPREGLTKSGFPMSAAHTQVGSSGQYSLVASLTGRPETKGKYSEEVYGKVNDALKGLASSYKGGNEVGMAAFRTGFSDEDFMMDAVTKHIGVEDARSGMANLDSDDFRARGTFDSIVNNNYDRFESEVRSTFDPAAGARTFGGDSSGVTDFTMLPGSGFTTETDPTNYNAARSRREQTAYAEFDAASAPNFEPAPEPKVKIHRDIKQGTPEWLAMRQKYDITGSTVGSLLGSNEYTTMQKRVAEMEGLYSTSREANNEFTQRMFAKGHAAEAAARPRVEQQFGINIEEVGAITNSAYPDMMYSPDGLIGEDALWEHKNPERAGKFADLKAGEHKDYYDQIQLGMHLSGRNKTLFSQTIGNETRSEWFNADPDWFDNNKERLASISGRRQAVRDYQAQNYEQFADDLQNAGDDKEAKRILNRYRRGAQNAAKGDNSDFAPSNAEHYQEAVVPSSSTGLSVGASGGLSPMAQAVKDGLIAAKEEEKSKGAGVGGQQADADFDDLGSPRGFSNQDLQRNLAEDGSGGGGRRGNGGGGSGGRDPWDSVAGGIAGGSLSSAGSGIATALSMNPWGRAAVVAYGAAQITDEVAGRINDSLGAAEDAGVSNPVQYASQMQGMEMMGLSESQAANVANRTHFAYGSLLNGDASASVGMITALRGLVNISDIRQTQGDPVALAAIIRQRGQARGWGQARISAALQSAGLQGMGRTYSRGDEQEQADAVRDRGAWTSTDDSVRAAKGLQASRSASSPGYMAQREGFENGSSLIGSYRDAIDGVRKSAGDISFIEGEESGGRDYTPDGEVVTSSSGARGRMQVLPSTARDPGYGIKPSDGSLEDDARVGREYYGKLVGVNGGDKRKAMAAYTDGQGTVDNAVKEHGADWLSFMPKQAQDRVSKYDAWSRTSGQSQTGADGFTRNGLSYGQSQGQTNINVQIDATVNGQGSRATVQATGGQTTTVQQNIGHGQNQRR